MKLPIVCSLCLCLYSHHLNAADAAANTANANNSSPWSHHLKLGVFLNSISTSDAEFSNDPTISGTSDNTTYTINLDGRLKWTEGKHSVQNDLLLKFGRKYDEDDKWQDSTDEIDYDGIYDYKIEKVHHLYANIGLDSIFTGPEPDEDALDPRTGKISAGYKYQRENILPIKDALSTRIGVRAQRSWGDNANDDQRETQTGIEWVTRYERKKHKDLDYYAQYEYFSEFEDMGHSTHLFTAGLNYKITPIFSLKFDIRAYYETEPEDSDNSVNPDTYNNLSMRQETLIGFTFEF